MAARKARKPLTFKVRIVPMTPEQEKQLSALLDDLIGELVQQEIKKRTQKPDLSARGPYATKDDRRQAKELGITVRQLRQDRAKEDRAK